MSIKTKDSRTRNFATVVYPESAPEDWLSILSEMKIPCFVSPFHNLDVNPTGEVKKEHFHVLFMFEGKKSIDQVQEMVSQINGVGLEQVQSIRGYARYLCHLDNPEKTQYSVDQVKQYGGADYLSIIGLAIDKYKALGDMCDWCVVHHCTSFAALSMYAKREEYSWYRVLCDNGAVFMGNFLKSLAWTNDSDLAPYVDM